MSVRNLAARSRCVDLLPPLAKGPVPFSPLAGQSLGTSKFSVRWSFLAAMLLGTYLLFSHGCHADVDDEPGLLPDVTGQQQQPESRE